MGKRGAYFGCLYLPMLIFTLLGTLFIDLLFWGSLELGWPPTEEVKPLGDPSPAPAASVLAVGVYLNLFFACVCWIGWAWFARRFNPRWRSAIQTTPFGTRVRLNRHHRPLILWAIALGSVGCGFFASALPWFATLVPGFGWWTLGYCVLIGLMLTWHSWRYPPEGSYLQDDPAAGTVSWRLYTQKGYRSRAVCRSAITAVSVREGQVPPYGKTHQVVVHWQLPGGPPESDVVGGYPNPADAEALAGWLRERLGVTDDSHR